MTTKLVGRRSRVIASLACAIALVTLPFSAALAQTSAPATAARDTGPGSHTLAVAGHTGQAPVVLVNGRSFVDVEALARLTGGSISFRNGQTILSIPSGTPSDGSPRDAKGFSPGFLRAAIEEMTDIREWRIAIVSAVQNNSAVTENWVGNFRRDADRKLALASAAIVTESDRSGFQLLSNEFRNMQQLSDQFLALNASVSYTSPTSFDNNPLDARILTCARALASMAASNQFQDDNSCH